MKMEKWIWFDMDGTIADLYGVEGWLPALRAECAIPYLSAKPLLNMSALARRLNTLHRAGWSIGIISWGSKMASEAFDEEVAEAKRQWLNRHLHSVQFDRIDVVKHGTPKHEGRFGILFDDEEKNREAWGEGAFDVQNILEILKAL